MPESERRHPSNKDDYAVDKMLDRRPVWGERIKARREELGLTIEQLAVRLDVHLATAYRLEGSEGDPRRSRMIQIADKLGVNPCTLFFDEHEAA